MSVVYKAHSLGSDIYYLHKKKSLSPTSKQVSLAKGMVYSSSAVPKPVQLMKGREHKS